MTRIINTLSEISDDYDALFVDLWGCVHNGIKVYPAANAALQKYRNNGGIVVLLTNSPKPRLEVEKQITTFGVWTDSWDIIASSGDSARVAMFEGVVGQKIFYIGPERDLSFFKPVKLLEKPLPIERVELQYAEGMVCTGPFDPDVSPEKMIPQFLKAKERDLKLLCANPDIVVDRGKKREWCAGALAKIYTDIGGESLYFGKPHSPIYNLARRRLKALGKNIPDSKILAIGDGSQTDIRGAIGENIDSLFITGGLARSETQTDKHPNTSALNRYFDAENVQSTYAIGYLR